MGGVTKTIALPEERLPSVDEEKCSGCGLCVQVCSVWDCVTMKQKSE